MFTDPTYLSLVAKTSEDGRMLVHRPKPLGYKGEKQRIELAGIWGFAGYSKRVDRNSRMGLNSTGIVCNFRVD